MEFSKKLKELRIEKNLTQSDLSRATLISRTTISKYENGTLFPSKYNLKIIADYFGLTVSELLSDEEKANENSKIQSDNFCISNDVSEQTKIYRRVASISFFINFIAVLLFSFYHQIFSGAEVVTVLVIFIPNVFFLLVKLNVVAIARKDAVKYELNTLLASLSLYIPFIIIKFIFFDRYDLIHYAIAFSVNIFIALITFCAKRKKFDFSTVMGIIFSLLIFFAYVISQTGWTRYLIVRIFNISYLQANNVKYVIGCFFKFLIIGVLIVFNVRLLIISKLNVKEIIMSLIICLGLLLIKIVAEGVANKINVFISLALFFILIMQVKVKNKLILKRSFLIYVYALFVGVLNFVDLFYDLKVIPIATMKSPMNNYFLCCMSMILLLQVAKEWICKKTQINNEERL